MKNKKILEVCLSPDLGGLELFMVNCFNFFSTKTDTKVVVAPDKKLDSYIRNENKFQLKRNKLFPLLPAIKLAKIIDQNEIDIVHFHWTKDMPTVILAKVLSTRKPKVIQTRNMTMTRFKDDFYHKWLYKNINTMHAVTYQVKEQLKKFIPSDIRPKLEMVYMGTKKQERNDKRIEELKDTYNITDEFVIGIVGRIEEDKGQYLLIEAAAILKDLNIKVFIIGHTMDEIYLKNLKQKVQELNIEDKIIFTGFTKKVNEYMSFCDTVILATTKETFGLVVIEAMINQVCMIATNNGGPLEIIDDNKTGLLFDRSNNDLASKIKLLYDNPILKKELASKGFNKAEKTFNSDIQLNKLYEVINES